MTEHQKRLAIIGSVILVALLLLLFRQKPGAVGATADSGYSLPAVTGPSLGPMYDGGGSSVLVIPGLNLSGPNLNMIGACCSDCMGGPKFTNPQQAAVVINNDSYSPTIVNYTYPAPSQSFSGVASTSRTIG